MANTYVLLSASGKALFFDFGYDFVTGVPAGFDRASRRPWLYTIPTLKKQFNVKKIDVALPTHFHDDHVAGLNLLRRVEGTKVWAAESFAGILENPAHYNLPCLWYDPIPVDRVLPQEKRISWEEYSLTLHALPGHTRYAVAVFLEVDGRRVLVTGDQYQGNDGLEFNYVYQNDYQVGDYRKSAALYSQLEPDLILPGHWDPLEVTENYFGCLEDRGEKLERLHQELTPAGLSFGPGEKLAAIHPYQVFAQEDSQVLMRVRVRNPFPEEKPVEIEMISSSAELDIVASSQEGGSMGDGARSSADCQEVGPPKVMTSTISGNASKVFFFQLQTGAGFDQRRARVAVDLRIGEHHFGQVAEALVTSST
jgi:glyoxylase-like metal-dependent hydrolase (beta-lactamase superfamily II)